MNLDTPQTPAAGPPDSPGFRRMFAPGRLTLGAFFPLAAYAGDMPDLEGQAELAAQADQGGFSALWTRDVPLQDPSFGDLGQVIDPFVWMGYMLNHVKQATFATGSLILPLRHPIHVAKAAASIDQLSGGRFVMGVASGDRAIEFPAFGREHATRGKRFRESLAYLRQLLEQDYPSIQSRLGVLRGANLQPKPVTGRLPIGVTGSSQQGLDWIAQHSDFWLTYPRPLQVQSKVLQQWKAAVRAAGHSYEKPVAQSLYIDLSDDAKRLARPIHLGYELGREQLLELLHAQQDMGVNHVAFVLKFSQRPIRDVIQELVEEVVPHFPAYPV